MDSLTFKDIAIKYNQYINRINELNRTGDISKIATIADELGQFLCDANRELLMRASNVDDLTQSVQKEYKTFGFQTSNEIRQCAHYFASQYKILEKLQRKNIFPTNLSTHKF